MKKMRFEAGFTLIELIITVSIILLTALFSAPAISDWGPYFRMKEDAQTVAGMLTSARFEAVKRQRNVVVSFSTSSETVTVFVDSNGDGTQDTGEATLNTYTLGRSVDFGVATNVNKDIWDSSSSPSGAITFADNQVSFSSNGAANSGAVYFKLDPNEATGDTDSKAYAVGVSAAGGVRAARWNTSGGSGTWD